MIKKLTALAVALSLLISVAGSPVVAAAPSVTQSSAAIAFPNTLTFNISTTSSADITDIRLHYVIERASLATVTSEVDIPFTAGKKADASWTLEMVKLGGLPTGTIIDYWWTVTDTTGGKADSAKSKVTFEDKRYTWKSIDDGLLTIYWYNGTDAFAGSLMTAAKDGLKRLADKTGATPEKPVRIYVYSGAQDMQGSLINPQEWTGGVNYPDYSIIVIGIAPSDLSWGVSAVAHELTHQIIGQVTSNPYGGLPTWLDEGLAVNNEEPPAQDYPGIIAQGISANALITVRSLASPFSANGNQAYLSYAESYSIVKYLIDKYGEPKMLELLKTFHDGSTYDNALKKVYGFDMDGLNKEWGTPLSAIPISATKDSVSLCPSGFDRLFGSLWENTPFAFTVATGAMVANRQ
jgi:hypothetical protein